MADDLVVVKTLDLEKAEGEMMLMAYAGHSDDCGGGWGGGDEECVVVVDDDDDGGDGGGGPWC